VYSLTSSSSEESDSSIQVPSASTAAHVFVSSIQVPSASTAEHVFSSMTDAAASSTMGEAWATMPIKVMRMRDLTVMVGYVVVAEYPAGPF